MNISPDKNSLISAIIVGISASISGIIGDKLFQNNYMNRVKKFLKKNNKYVLVVLSLVIIFGILIPIIINESYKFNKGYITHWKASDTLSFYGTFLSFIGTVSLGLFAVYQNTRLIGLEERRTNLEEQPFVTITNWEVTSIKSLKKIYSPKKLSFEIMRIEHNSKDNVMIKLYFINTSNSFTTIIYDGAEVFNNSKGKNNKIGEWSQISTNQQNTRLMLKSDGEGEINFICTKDKLESLQGKRVVLSLILENKINDKYKLTIDIIFAYSSFESEEIYMPLFPQNYKIQKI